MNSFNKKPVEDLPLMFNIFNGTVAGAAASAITCPLDVVKTRIQVEHSHNEKRYKNMLDGMTRLRKKQNFLFIF